MNPTDSLAKKVIFECTRYCYLEPRVSNPSKEESDKCYNICIELFEQHYSEYKFKSEKELKISKKDKT
jgi:hypothetical protein